MEKQFIYGEYVLTGTKNAFNHKTSWWMSKRNCLRAVYCFSTEGDVVSQKKELARQLAGIDGYIQLFDAASVSCQ